VAGAQASEIRTLAAILDELDYYQVLEIERKAPGSVIRNAYHSISRRFHPDANRHLDAETHRAVEQIAKRVTEAYSVLRDPRRRQVYDLRLGKEEGNVRMPLVEAQSEAERQASAERGGRTPNGRRYYALVSTNLQCKDWAAAERNLRMALTFEPDNGFFREKLAEVQTKNY
jgi:curved DNA-binding protein CbpA